MFDSGQYILFQNSKKLFLKGLKLFSRQSKCHFLRIKWHYFGLMWLRIKSQKKKAHKYLRHTFFSINLIQRRNQMSFNYSESILDLIPEEFDLFVTQAPSQAPASPALLTNQRFKKEIETFTPLQARQALLRLIEKSKASSQRKNWKVDETNYLLFIVERYCLTNGRNSQQLDPLDWQYISRLVPNRDSSACEFRYLSLCPASITHVPWSTDQRELLLRIIQNQNSNSLNWKRISQRLYEESKEKVFRTGKQCREHYTCFLRPNLKKGAWTDEEDYQLMNLFLKLGKKWSKMTKFIDGRNQNSIKNRFFLMFESKNQVRYSNSDLVKMVRRRMDKISKKLAISHEQKCLSEQNINLTPTNSETSNFQTERQDDEGERAQSSSFHDEIFFNECQSHHSQTAVKIEEVDFFHNEEFERYIDL